MRLGRVGAAALLLALVGLSAWIRTRAIGSPFWIDEGLSVGIASHPFGEIFHALREDGSPPLYYLLLHFWMEAFGRTEADTRALSLVFALLSVPAALWAGWSLFGRRAGWIAAALAALTPFLDAYAQETRMYSLLALLCLLGAACFAEAFVRRRRVFLPPLAALLAAIAYTHNWGLFFDAGCALALIPIWRASAERRAIVRDAAIAFGAAAILYAPWIPTLLSQAAHTGAPWATSPKLRAPIQTPGNLLGGDFLSFVLLLGAATGLVALWNARREATPGASAAHPAGASAAHPTGRALAGRALVAIAWIAVATILLAWTASQLSPAWSTRYQGVILGALILIVAAGIARSGRLGLLALVFVLGWWATATPTAALKDKSNVDDVAAQLGPLLRPGDQVVSTQPEQVAILAYYLPPGLAYSDAIGPVADPLVMDWRDALDHLRAARASTALTPVLNQLPPGRRLLLVAPVTDNPRSWRAPWTKLVRRRSAQYGAAIQSDPRFRRLAAAPTFYRYPSTVAVRAVLYEKTRP
jgi:hypothetical protein